MPYRDRRRIQQYWHEVLTALEDEPSPIKKAEIAANLIEFTQRLRLELLKVRNRGIVECREAGMTPYKIGQHTRLAKTQVTDIAKKPIEPYADIRDDPDLVVDISYFKAHLEDEESVL